jgi:hypothetical protein
MSWTELDGTALSKSPLASALLLRLRSRRPSRRCCLARQRSEFKISVSSEGGGTNEDEGEGKSEVDERERARERTGCGGRGTEDEMDGFAALVGNLVDDGDCLLWEGATTGGAERGDWGGATGDDWGSQGLFPGAEDERASRSEAWYA